MTDTTISLFGYLGRATLPKRRRARRVARQAETAGEPCEVQGRTARVIDIATRRSAGPADLPSDGSAEGSIARLLRGSPEWAARVSAIMQRDRIEDFDTLCGLMGVGPDSGAGRAHSAEPHRALSAGFGRPARSEGMMSVQVLADGRLKISDLRAALQPLHTVTAAMLDCDTPDQFGSDAVIVAADLRVICNIAAIKAISRQLQQAQKRIFLIDELTHLSIAQARALGATTVLPYPPVKSQLLAKLSDGGAPTVKPDAVEAGAKAAASAGFEAIAAMFSSVGRGAAIDVAGAQHAARKIADSIAERGLSTWLETVRRYHKGTYQHCLLVTGITVDFGLSLGVSSRDIERLSIAAMFHDIGKATIPLAVLDKPGRLNAEERALVETHAVAGWDALSDCAEISEEVRDAVRHHHEFLDGSGYPDGLCDRNIADIVRILTIADIFAALIEWRSYKPPLPRRDAYEVVCGMQGKLERSLLLAFKNVALTR